jgi:hypothetical protein
MPQLPNLGDIPQAQFDRIVNAFPGETATEKSQAYRDWLLNRLIDRVAENEMRKAQFYIYSQLPPRPIDPEFPE